MQESVVIELLKTSIRNILNTTDNTWNDEQRAEFSERLAEVAWRGLLFYLRQEVTSSSSITLREFGRFTRTAEGWHFSPAASLEAAHALTLPPEKGATDNAYATIFHLHEALQAAARLPDNVAISFDPGPWSLVPDSGSNVERKVADVIQFLAGQLIHISTDLAGPSSEIPQWGRFTRESQLRQLLLNPLMGTAFDLLNETFRRTRLVIRTDEPSQKGGGSDQKSE